MDAKPKDSKNTPLDPDVALRRLVYVALVGCAIIFAYGSRFTGQSFLSVSSVAVMTGGAALLTGGLLGFLFGVPHTREPTSDSSEDSNTPDGSPGTGRKEDPKRSNAYRPNTSLEQVSDWLTKIIVGVGLVQFRPILDRFWALAGSIAKELGGVEAQAFAAAVLVYFAVAGFVFGFLWARIYLPGWFSTADAASVRQLEKQVNRLQEQQEADSHALALTLRQLGRSSYDSAASEEEIAKAIQAASRPVRAQIFNFAAEASAADKNAGDYDTKLEGVIAILNGLIKSDPERRYHTNHAELSYALRRKRPRDLEGAVEAISQAIERRDARGERGWTFYEFHRAKCRIEQEVKVRPASPSESAVVDEILKDLRVAYSQPEKWERWVTQGSDVQKWMEVNHIDAARLRVT